MPLDEPTTTQPTGVPRKLGILREWVRRLRSGDYRQGNHSLKIPLSGDDAQYCCLGVLGEIYNERHPDQHVQLEGHGFLPRRVWEDCTVDRVDPAVGPIADLDPRIQPTWAAFNDTKRLSFHEIADRVERHLIRPHEGN